MTLALATRGYVSARGAALGVLSYLYPDTVSVKKSTELLMAVILNSPAPGDQVVSLSSDAPAIVSIPASVTVLDGQFVATFIADAVEAGAAQVSATLGSETVTADVTVIQLGPAESPTGINAVSLKPEALAGGNLRPKITSAKET